ncbi:MAG: hypothetical protein LHW48_04655 [Candidatus Cloacimonetes bacterium]|nr:hypothetical protein [Candidatus Cloacimonadota bacterium]
MKRHYVDKWCTKEDMEAEIMQERCQNDLDEFLAKIDAAVQTNRHEEVLLRAMIRLVPNLVDILLMDPKVAEHYSSW